MLLSKLETKLCSRLRMKNHRREREALTGSTFGLVPENNASQTSVRLKIAALITIRSSVWSNYHLFVVANFTASIFMSAR